MPDAACSLLRLQDAREAADLLRSRSAATRKKVRYKTRRAAREGVTHRLLDPTGAADVDRLLEVHKRRWASQDITPEHLTGRFSEHLREAVPALAELGEAFVYEVRTPQQLLGSRLLLQRSGWLGDYLYGLEPEALAWSAIDMNVVLMSSLLSIANDRDVETIDFLRGLEPHKQVWEPTPVLTVRLVLGRRRPAWIVYCSGLLVRNTAARVLRRSRVAVVVTRETRSFISRLRSS